MTDYDDVIDDAQDDSGDPDYVKGLRAKAKKSDAFEREAAAARRELALMKAGVDLDSPHGKLFAKGYDGELTVDAVKAAATEMGVIAAVTPDATPDEVANLNRFDSAAQGSESPTDFDQAADALAKVPYLGADGQPNPDGPRQIMAALQAAGLTISHDQPGAMFQIPGTNPIPA